MIMMMMILCYSRDSFRGKYLYNYTNTRQTYIYPVNNKHTTSKQQCQKKIAACKQDVIIQALNINGRDPEMPTSKYHTKTIWWYSKPCLAKPRGITDYSGRKPIVGAFA